MKQNSRRNAFTLIELLTVIAVIAILAAILIPVTQGVLNRSKVMQSVSQIRSLSIGILNVASSTGEFPAALEPGKGGWDVALDSERNPGSLGLNAPLDDVERPNRPNPEQWRSYSMVINRQSGQALGVARYANPKDRSMLVEVDSPANTLLLVERFDSRNWAYSGSGAIIDRPTQQYPEDRWDDFTIGGKSVYSFCDGHVETLAPEETVGTGTLERPLGFWSVAPND